MIGTSVRAQLRKLVDGVIGAENDQLTALREIVRPMRGGVTQIQPRNGNAVSLVGTDGGNNQIQFDPFSVQLVRVVDSQHNDLMLEAVTPRTPIAELNRRHWAPDGSPLSPIGRMGQLVGFNRLEDVGYHFRDSADRSPAWVQEYRGLAEWASLLDLVRKSYGSDTLIVRDGPLREKMLGKWFRPFVDEVHKAIDEAYRTSRRRLFVAGIVKKSSVLQKFRLALALEGVLRTRYPAYVQVPEAVLKATYLWGEWASSAGRTDNEFMVAGKMFLVKFGASIFDQIWVVDVLDTQVPEAGRVFGYLLNDARGGFPVPHYPMCLQKAHEAAALVDFDLDILEAEVRAAIKGSLGRDHSKLLDELALQETDVSQRRY